MLKIKKVHIRNVSLRTVSIITAFICVFMLFAGHAAAAEKNNKPQEFILTAEEQAYLENMRTRTVTIAYSYDLVNFELDGEQCGMLEPVLDVLRNEFGLSVNLVKTNWHDAFVKVDSGEADFYGPVAISEDRRQKYITVDPFYRSYSKIMTRVDEPVNSMIGLYNRQIGLLEGSVIKRTMQTYLGPNGQIVYFPTMDDMIAGLKDGTIDAFSTVDNAEFEILANDDIRFEFSIDNFYVEQGFISGREDMQTLAVLLNRYLKANPQVSDKIVETRYQSLLRHSQERLADEINFLQENYGEVIIYADASLYPLCYFENGEIKGMLLEITEIFERLSGVKIKFRTDTDNHTDNDNDNDNKSGTNSAVNMLTAGEFMAIAGAYYDIDTWNNPAIEYSPLLWMETLHTYSYKDYTGLQGRTLGALSLAADYLGWNNTTGSAPVLYESCRELLSALKNNKIDAAFMGEMRFNYGYSVLKDYSLREVTGISAEAPVHMLYGVQNTEFNALFNEAMTLFQILNPQSASQWKTQSDKYKSDYIRMRYTQQIWVTVVIIVFIIMLAALVYLFIRNFKAYRSTKKRLADALDKVHYDELTGIYNRRYLDESLRQILNDTARSGGMLSVMMADVDFFKKYNDTYGHSEGDSCLRFVAAAIKNSITRADDFVARYGGEEFAVILPNTDESGARVIANRILENVRKCRLPHEKSDIAEYVTISIGVTTGGNTGGKKNSEDYIKRADEALYMSKQNGRNRYTFINFTDSTGKNGKNGNIEIIQKI